MPAPQAAHPDERAPAAEAPDQLRADAHRPEPCAWDASDAVHPDATDAADLPHQAPSDADAERSAGLAPDARARDA